MALAATVIAAGASCRLEAPAALPQPQAVILAEFGNGKLGRCMVSVARRESRLNPRAANWSDRHSDGSYGSFGLFQIGAIHRAPGETIQAFARRMFNARANAQLAHRLYRGAGLRPWGGYC